MAPNGTANPQCLLWSSPKRQNLETENLPVVTPPSTKKKLMVSPPDVTRDAQAVAKQIVLVFPT